MAFMRALERAIRASVLVFLLAGPGRMAAATELGPDDYDVEMGHFYTQTGIGVGTGFAILNELRLGIRMEHFWDEYQRLGGVQTFGYPISGVFRWAELNWAQLTQKSLLYWNRFEGRLTPANIFEVLELAGQDDFLESQGIPRPIPDDGAESLDQAVEIRLGWLENDELREAYLANPNPARIERWTRDDAIFLRGLPMSKPQRMGPFIAQRFQRAALQLWVEDVPGGQPPGTITAVNAGDLFRQAGLLPDPDAAQPRSPPNVPFDIAPGTRLVFTSQRTGSTQIYISGPQGGHTVAVTRSDNVKRFPTWSSDGTKLAYALGGPAPPVDQRQDPSAGELIAPRIAIYDLLTGVETAVSPEGIWAAGPSWSPEADKLVYSGWADGQSDLYVVSAQDGSNSKLIELPGDQSQPDWSHDGQTILFISDHEGSRQIYALNPDGSMLRRVTQSDASESGPRWSPDGKSIAFARFTEFGEDIFTMDAGGGNERQLTRRPGSDYAPDFTPDGKFVTYVSERAFDEDIFVTDIDGARSAKLVDGDGADRDPRFARVGTHPGRVNPVPAAATLIFYSLSISEGPSDIWATTHTTQPLEPVNITSASWISVLHAWSPDGQWLAFTSSRDGSLDLYAARSDGSALAQLTNAGSLNTFPAYSPDGRRILFSSDRHGSQNLFVVNADGSGMLRLTFTEGNDVDPVWGADGDEIIFASNRDGNFEIFRMRLSDPRAIQITSFPGDARNPTISPDGGNIVFAVHSGFGEGIYIMAPDGSRVAPLIRDGWEYRTPAWSPDGNLIAFASKRSEDGSYGIYVLDPRRGVFWGVADTPADDFKPVWRPGTST